MFISSAYIILFISLFFYALSNYYSSCAGCCFNQQGSGCSYTQLPQLAPTVNLSASQCDYACKCKCYVCLGHFCALFPPFIIFWSYGEQADVETDEVYAQMTLQPLSPVNHFLLFEVVCFLACYYFFVSWHNFLMFGSKSKRMCTCCLQNWVLLVNSQQIISVRRWLQAILVLMEDSLFPAGQLKKSFLLL